MKKHTENSTREIRGETSSSVPRVLNHLRSRRRRRVLLMGSQNFGNLSVSWLGSNTWQLCRAPKTTDREKESRKVGCSNHIQPPFGPST